MMVSRAMRVAALAAVLAVPLLMASGSGAVSTGSTASTITQSGLRNYAGPNCPGVGWSCTTSTRVVQFAAPGGENRFECTPQAPATSPPNSCVVDQHGGTNHARCFIRDTTEPSAESCDITQDGERNYSDVHM